MAMLIFIITIAVVVVINNNTTSYKINTLPSETNEVDPVKATLPDNFGHDRSRNIRMPRQLSGMTSPNDYGYLNIYVRQACRDDRQYPFQEMRFPYALYDRRRFRFSRSWVRFSRWMPIYADRFTRHTIIYSRIGVYVLPPLVNNYGKLFSVAELLAYGYATLLRNGAPMSSHFNIRYYAHPGAYVGRGIPRFNPRTGTFMDAVQSNYQSHFKPECHYEGDETTGDESPIPYDEDSNNSPETMDEEYNQPRRRPRPQHRSNY